MEMTQGNKKRAPDNASTMEITNEGITFRSLISFSLFLREFELIGQVKLLAPIQDKQQKILLKENVYIKENILKKLLELEGQYSQIFKINLTDELLKSLKDWIVKLLLLRLEDPSNEFLRKIFAETRHRYRAYIHASLFKRRALTLTLFKLARERQTFFNHLGDLGLLSLGIVIQKNYRFRFINRNAFLMGLSADLNLSGSPDWKDYPSNDEDKKKLANHAAEVARKFRLPEEVVDAIRNHPLLSSLPPGTDPALPEEEFPELDPAEISETFYEEILKSEEQEEEADSGKNGKSGMEYSEGQAMILTEILKIARYIENTARNIKEKEHFAEELVYIVAYNSARGYFHNDLIQPIIKRFREYEEMARRIMKVAEIERSCLHPPSAWAYPKPRSTQILCVNHVVECPHLIQGWDIHVVSPHESVGWIGANLSPGHYSKCQLETRLEPWESKTKD